ncbi:hypothetical protein BH09MYX1_BH09MYX1_39340 [soil metagenome]
MPALAAMLYACGGDDTTQPPGSDAGPDVTVDSSVDAKLDAKTDAKVDGSTDAKIDSQVTGVSKQIQDVRAAAIPQVVVDAGADSGSDAASEGGDGGSTGIPVNNLPIDNAIVTYVRPAVGTDPAGFFIQGEKAGPAIFVAIDPTTLSPVPVAGDEVSFKVTAVLNVSSLREIVALTGFTRISQGKDLTTLLQDISAATDVITNLDGYESEYIKLTATAAGTFGGAGAGSVSAQITTTGIPASNTNFRIRFPQPLQDALGVSQACSFTVTGAMWRFTTQAQPSGFVNGDVSGLVCPAPTVLGAAATNLTTVLVNFDRLVDTNSLNVNGSQFTVNNGLTVTAAALTGPRQVTLTTSAQTPIQAYTVTVANTVKDTLGKTIGNTGNTANFLGYVVPATVRLNELALAIPNGFDLIELRVVTAGNLNGITIQENFTGSKTVATLPVLQVAVDDLVVVHLTPAIGVTDETSSKTGCVDAACYAGAWDVRGSNNDLTNNARALYVRSPANGAIQDGVSYYSSALTPAVAWYLETNALSAATQWVGCAGNNCANNAAAILVSVNYVGIGTSTATSLRRVSNTDTNALADWAVGTSSFGVANP